ALQPAEVTKVVLDEDAERIDVVVPDDQLSLAIGRRGQNVRLASQLTGWEIDIMTEQEESERRQQEFAENTARFMEALNVDEMVAQLLASEGFGSIEEVAYVDADEISTIEGFDEETAEELQARAREFLDKLEQELDEERKALGVEDALKEIDGLTTAMLVTLGKNDIKTLEDFAGCAVDDLCGWIERKDGEVQRFEGALDEYKVSRTDAEAMIMQARIMAGWVTEEELLAAQQAEEAEAAGEGEEGEAASPAPEAVAEAPQV
ncbi:MAG: transcription termination/antitermination protein NusA, partial [Rhizobiaceae bacterium]|nr:transcription termination/antitermination protein NusA [Rhizobiaceae bacterium]